MKLRKPKGFQDIKDNYKTNGCGDSLTNIKFGTFFKRSCDIHDIEYLAKDELKSDRKDADKRFLHNMLKESSVLPAHQRFLRSSQAYVYYAAVRIFGGLFY